MPTAKFNFKFNILNFLNKAKVIAGTQANQDAFISNMTNPAYQAQLFSLRQFIAKDDDIKANQLGLSLKSPQSNSETTTHIINNSAYQHQKNFYLLQTLYNLTRASKIKDSTMGEQSLTSAGAGGAPSTSSTSSTPISEIEEINKAPIEAPLQTEQLKLDIKNNPLSLTLQKFLKKLSSSDQQLFKAALINWLNKQPNEFINKLEINQSNNPLANFLLEIHQQKDHFKNSSQLITPHDKKLARPLFLKFMQKIDIGLAADVEFNHDDKDIFNSRLNLILNAGTVNLTKPATLQEDFDLGGVTINSHQQKYSIAQNLSQRMLENAQIHAYLNDKKFRNLLRRTMGLMNTAIGMELGANTRHFFLTRAIKRLFKGSVALQRLQRNTILLKNLEPALKSIFEQSEKQTSGLLSHLDTWTENLRLNGAPLNLNDQKIIQIGLFTLCRENRGLVIAPNMQNKLAEYSNQNIDCKKIAFDILKNEAIKEEAEYINKLQNLKQEGLSEMQNTKKREILKNKKIDEYIEKRLNEMYEGLSESWQNENIIWGMIENNERNLSQPKATQSYPLLRFMAKTEGNLEWLAILNALSLRERDASLIADQLFEGAKNLSQNTMGLENTENSDASVASSPILKQKIFTEKVGFSVGIAQQTLFQIQKITGYWHDTEQPSYTIGRYTKEIAKTVAHKIAPKRFPETGEFNDSTKGYRKTGYVKHRTSRLLQKFLPAFLKGTGIIMGAKIALIAAGTATSGAAVATSTLIFNYLIILPASVIAALGIKNAVDIRKDLNVLDANSTHENQAALAQAVQKNTGGIYQADISTPHS